MAIPKYVELDMGLLTLGENPRLHTNLKIPELARSVEANGIRKPLEVRLKDGIHELLCGNRRIAAARKVHDENPEKLKQLHPNGLPCLVYEGITDKEALEIKLDHSGQESLTNVHELQMSMNMMFKQGCTEAEAANVLMPLIQKFAPLRGDKKEEIEKLEAAIAEAVEAKDFVEVGIRKKALYERIAKLYRGRCQGYHLIARSPDIINACLYYKACGEKPKAFQNVPLTKSLTGDDIKELYKAYQDDLKEHVDENNIPLHNQANPGPKFKELFQQKLAAEANGTKGDDKPKAMTRKAMEAEVNDRRWKSDGLHLLTMRHSGDKDVSVEALEKADKAYEAIDLVRKYDEKLYEKVLKRATSIRESLNKKAEADVEAKGEEDEENKG